MTLKAERLVALKASVSMSLILVLMGSLFACSSSERTGVWSLVWIDDGRVFYVRRPISDGLGELWVRTRKGDVSQVQLKETPSCPRVDFAGVFPSDGTRFGVSQICDTYDYAVSEFDPSSGNVNSVVRLGGHPEMAVRWSGDRSQVVVTGCVQVGWIPVVDGRLKEWFPEPTAPGACGHLLARTMSPSLVNEGASVVYLNSPNAFTGGDGAHNYASNWTISILDRVGQASVPPQPRVIQGDIVDARALAVSRSGTALAFCGVVGGRKGLWQRSLQASEKASMVVEKGCDDVAFSPDGRSVAAVVDGEVAFFDL